MHSSTVRFESRTVIERPAAVVFDRLADLPSYRRWMHRTGLFRRNGLTSEAPVRKGTTYIDATRMGTFEAGIPGKNGWMADDCRRVIPHQ